MSDFEKGQIVAYNHCDMSLHIITKILNQHHSSIDDFLKNKKNGNDPQKKKKKKKKKKGP